MATLLHHIQPWVHKSIADAEECIEKRVAEHSEQKIQTIQKCMTLLIFPTLATYLCTIQSELASLSSWRGGDSAREFSH